MHNAAGLGFVASLALLPVGCAVAESDEMAQPDAGDMMMADAAPSSPDAMEVDLCGDALAQLAFDFEAGESGFEHDSLEEVVPPPVEWRYDHWEAGSPSGQVTTCGSGSSCFATNLTGNYIQCQRAHLTSPSINVTACNGEGLVFRLSHLYDFWQDGAFHDGGTIELSGDDGISWQPADLTMPGTIEIQGQLSSYSCVEKDNFVLDGQPGFIGASASWTDLTIPIPPAMVSSHLRIRFRYASGVSSMTTNPEQSQDGTRPGWYVDNIRVERQ